MINKGLCDEGYIWNSSNWECEFDKLCDVGEYLDYKNFKCRKGLIDKLIEECSENIDRNEMIYESDLKGIPLNATMLNDYEKIGGSCRVYISLLTIFFMISIRISSVFIYFYWYLK